MLHPRYNETMSINFNEYSDDDGKGL